ncbi:MAG: hypothetical protein ABIT08_14955 [Bacteroidia bacterium]
MFKNKITHSLFSTRFLLLLSAIVLFIFSCKRDEEKVGWETKIVTPLLKSSLSIKDIISDTLIQSGSDGLLKVVYENHLYTMSLDSIFDIPDTGVTKIYNLDSISLYSQTVSYPVTLGSILSNIPIIGPIIAAQQGNSIPIPAIGPVASTPFVIHADTLFTTMTLITGFIDISLYNGLPIEITNLTFDLKDSVSNANVATLTFPSILPGDTAVQTASLAGKTVEGIMIAQILSMSSPGSATPVLIDTNNSMLATLKVYDLHPSSATAIFPAQDLVNKSQPFYFKFDSVELKEARLQSGQIVLDLTSTLQDSVHFTYSLPSATFNGTPFIVTKTLPPAPAGGTSTFSQAYDFSGYHLDLTNSPDQDTVNTMHNSFLARVDSTGLMTTISLTDSFYADIHFVGLNPSYGRGYIGQQNVSIGPSQIGIDIFKNVTADSTFLLEDVKMSIVTENGIGADAKVNLTNLTSVHSHPPRSVVLTGSAVANPFIIQRATDNNGMPPVTIVSSELLLNKTNSNSPAFVSNLPDTLKYQMSLQTNPNGNNGLYNDFIYADHLMEFNVDIEMPLSYTFVNNNNGSLNFTLTDTATFSLNEQDVSRIKDGTLTLIADNGFPFSVDISLMMLNADGDVIHDLVQHSIIASAPVGSDGKVTEKQQSKIKIAVDQALLNELFATSHMKIIAKYSTSTPANVYYKIYSDYTIDFQLTGNFTYLAHH